MQEMALPPDLPTLVVGNLGAGNLLFSRSYNLSPQSLLSKGKGHRSYM
jgi:hypothetical protein